MKYEIHITVEGDVSSFKEDCQAIGVKPILIETERKNAFSNQLMTSSKYNRDYHSDLCDFKLKIDRVVNELNRLNIAYDKIEIEECVYDSNISIDKKWLN
jgi:hypothetical protein